MGHLSVSLMLRFFGLYVGVSFFGAMVITLSNLMVLRTTWEYLLLYNLKAIAVQVFALVVIFQTITWFRMRKVRQYFKEGVADNINAIWNTLLRFPYEVFWGMVLFGLITSPIFHGMKLLWINQEVRDVFGWKFVDSFLFEQIICLMLAILFFSLIRRLLRPYITCIPSEHMNGFRRSTFLHPLLLSFGSLHLISILSLLRYVMKGYWGGHPMEPSLLFGIAGFTALFGVSLFYLLVREFRAEFQMMIGGLNALIQEDRSALHKPMPILSRDEIGQLGEAFNRLQDRTCKEYASLEEELSLACHIQKGLLPEPDHELGNCKVSALFQPSKEVGGDLFDMVEITEDRLAVLIGDVSGKGLSASLIMSATLALFRTEVRRGGTAGEIVTRLNRLFFETVNQELFVTVGMAIIDQRNGELEYASAGHMNPYILRDGKPMPVEVSSLPLGILPDEIYQEITLPLEPGDRILFFTDGVVEVFVRPDAMLGFEGLERFLTELDTSSSIKDQLAWLSKQIPQQISSPHQDDLTMVMVEWKPAMVSQKVG